jgi:hypothetical protein
MALKADGAVWFLSDSIDVSTTFNDPDDGGWDEPLGDGFDESGAEWDVVRPEVTKGPSPFGVWGALGSINGEEMFGGDYY